MKTSFVMLLTLALLSACGPFLSGDVNDPPSAAQADGGADFAAPTATGGDASNDVCRPCSQKEPLPGMQCVTAACACVNQNCCCR